MAIIGLLPASGKASRLKGIPKFCLPLNDQMSLMQWHVKQMLEVCDEVRVCTRADWVQLVVNMDMNVTLFVKEPTTMSDAIKFMSGNQNDTFLIGMPDTFILDCNKNIYKEMLQSDGDIVLGTWTCDEDLKGRVGQILVENDIVVQSVDKNPECSFNHMWGTMLLRKVMNSVDISKNHPGEQIQQWIDSGIIVKSVMPGGQYVDIGTVNGLKNFYRKID